MNEFWLELVKSKYLAILQQFSPKQLCMILENKKYFNNAMNAI